MSRADVFLRAQYSFPEMSVQQKRSNDPGGVTYGSRRVAPCATAGSGAMDTFDPGGVAYDDSSRVSLLLQTCGLAVRTRPLPGSENGPPLPGGSELTLATTGYRARPLRGGHQFPERCTKS